MATVALTLELSPAELLPRLPRRAGAFLLDGGSAHSWGRGEALLGWEPTRIVEVRATPPRRGCVAVDDPFALLERTLLAEPCAGIACALGYDLGRWVEGFGTPPPGDPTLPQLFAAVHPWVLAYSYGERRYELRSPHMNERELHAAAARLRDRIAAPEAQAEESGPASPIASNFSREAYLAAVGRVLAYIAAGDVYQVNLSQRFVSRSAIAPSALFARMVARHPAPYSGYIDGGAWALVSNSPECFLERSREAISTFPIKGTRPRGETRERDLAMAGALLSSVKDRAEHLMIVDLERNDLGRVCRVGSVHVPQLARLCSFPSLHHLESQVSGRLASDTSLASLLRATFPGGSITGAPKIRAMQIIDELETVGRDFYTGAIGFCSTESTQLNVAIRTATLSGGEVRYHAGGGIVADSDPDEEYEETRLKARAFFEALEVVAT